MVKPLHALIIDDSADDALLLVKQLKAYGYDVTFERVDTLAAWESVLKRQAWDIVLANDAVPGFSVPDTISHLKESCLDLPLIIVSGAENEENATQAMREGASDYLLKAKLNRLAPAVERELLVVEVRRERKRIEETLRESEMRVRRKLDDILSPEVDVSALELSDIIDCGKIQKMMDGFYRLTRIGIGIIDLHGKVLVGTGWQDICSKFHRVNPESCCLCVESDLELSHNVPVGTFKQYRCKNNMWDIATPIMLAGRHLGNIFLGQFLFDDEVPDYEVFRQQARRFGFNEDEYLAALDRVPRWSRDTVDTAMSFYAAFAEFVGNLSYSNIKLANALEKQKRAEESLREKTHFLQTLMDAIPNPIFYKDAEGVYQGCNAAFESYIGLNRNRIVGASAYDVAPKELADKYHEMDRALFSDGGVQVYESNVRYADGTLHDVIFNKATYCDEDGSLGGLVGIVLDITERKRAEDALKLNSERTATLLKLNQMTSATPRELMVFAFEEAVRLSKSKIGYLGFMNDDETVMTVHVWSRDVMPECNVADSTLDFPVGNSGLWGEAIRQHRPVVINDYIAPNPLKRGCPAGHVSLRRFMSVPVIVGSHIVLVAGVGNKEEEYDEADVQQLTLLMEGMWRLIEHRRAEDAIREINERFGSVMRAAISYSIVGTDPGGIIKVFNEGAELMLGYNADEVIDKVTPELFHDPEEVAVRAAEMGVMPGFEVFVAAVRQGGTETHEWTYIRKDGSRLTVSLSVAAMRSELGGLTGFIGISRDVTAEKKMEQQLLQSQKMETVGLLAGGVAHDFNNLLTPILGYTDMLLPSFSKDDPRYQQLQMVRQAADRAKELTQRLLAFSRKQIIELKTVNLGDIIYRFESMLHRTIRENIRIEVDVSPTLSQMRADAGQIEQVLLNLAVNAQDAMPDGGFLTIEAQDVDLDESYTDTHPEIKPGRYVVLAVSDTGSGMGEETLGHIFDPFFTTKELGKGTGLGLSTVYGIVKQHGGSINVYSETGKGSTFKVFFPRVNEGQSIFEQPSSLEYVVAHGGETLLVAEDNEMVRTLECQMLEGLGYRVISAESAEQCLNLAKKYEGPISMLLTDVIMPGMNGKELFKILSQVRPGLKVLFVSGYTSNVIGHHGILDEGVHFIQKPFSLHALSEKVRQVLDT